MGDNAPQVSGVKVYQAEAAGADEVILELDFGWTSDAEMSLIVHPMPHQAWLATPVVEVLSKLIVVKVSSHPYHCLVSVHGCITRLVARSCSMLDVVSYASLVTR